MKLFATRLWGFDPTTAPVITFSAPGYRESLLSRSAPGDRIIFVGTNYPPTDREDRGCILGMAEIGRLRVNTLQIVKRANTRAEDYRSVGTKKEFKWPYALLMAKAWSLPRGIKLKSVANQLSYAATSGAVEFKLKEERERILALQWEPHDLPNMSVIVPIEEAANLVDPRKPGPPPTEWSGMVTRTTGGPAFVYVLQFGEHDLWKVGWAVDPVQRCREINRYVPFELLKTTWRLVAHVACGSQTKAYDLEQAIHRSLGAPLYERFKCERKVIAKVWRGQTGSRF